MTTAHFKGGWMRKQDVEDGTTIQVPLTYNVKISLDLADATIGGSWEHGKELIKIFDDDVHDHLMDICSGSFCVICEKPAVFLAKRAC